MLNIALLGAGRIGIIHAENITANPNSRLVAVSDVNTAAAHKLAQTYGVQTRSAQDIMADPSIDALLIATSTDTHADLIEAATAAGKAALCEKPVDLSLARARACLAAVAQHPRPVMIGFNRRFDPNFAALKAQLDAGAIGKGELLSITSFDPAPPPRDYVSSGLFRDTTIHDFDMACWLFGAMPTAVTAVTTSVVDPAIGAVGDVDMAVTTLHFADNRLAVIKNSRRAVYGYDQRIELLGATGLLCVGNVLENTVTKITTDGALNAKPEYFFLERYMRSYAVEWNAFVQALLTQTAPPVTLADGVNALAVAEAATVSAQTNQTVQL